MKIRQRSDAIDTFRWQRSRESMQLRINSTTWHRGWCTRIRTFKRTSVRRQVPDEVALRHPQREWPRPWWVVVPRSTGSVVVDRSVRIP